MKERNAGRADSIEQVVAAGCCVGCGACAAVSGSPYEMSFTSDGTYRALRKPGLETVKTSTEAARRVCPFSGGSPNEDELAAESFPQLSYTDGLGRVRDCFAARVTDLSVRGKSSSGGITTWLLCELLERGGIDGVVHAKPSLRARGSGDPLCALSVSRSVEEIRSGTRSHYHPVEMSSVIEKIRHVDGAFAFVGLPCMVKAIHLLRRVDTEIAAKIKYTVGIVCGQLKSMNWTELLAWQAGIEPKNLTGVRFRELPSAGSTAKDYRFRYFSPKYTTGVAADTKGAVGANWAHAVQMIEACEYCDDVVGETADISIGDAWLSRYISDRYGTNLVITRSKELGDLIQRGSESGALWIEQLTHDEAIATQAGALRMRREGLAYRLWLREQNGEWHPTKRVRPSRTHIPKRRRRVYEVRALIRSRSVRLFAAAKETGNLSVFQRAIRRATRRHDRLSNPMYRRLLRAVLRRLRG